VEKCVLSLGIEPRFTESKSIVTTLHHDNTFVFIHENDFVNHTELDFMLILESNRNSLLIVLTDFLDRLQAHSFNHRR
jgi:hypothetical protein